MVVDIVATTAPSRETVECVVAGFLALHIRGSLEACFAFSVAVGTLVG